jgi:hypothetical protein
MKAIASLVLLGMLSGVAIAQTAEQCPPTTRVGDLLDCYNGTAPPHALGKPAMSNPAREKPAVSKDAPGTNNLAASKITADEKAKYVDLLDEENKKLDAKLRVICRGC